MGRSTCSCGAMGGGGGGGGEAERPERLTFCVYLFFSARGWVGDKRRLGAVTVTVEGRLVGSRGPVGAPVPPRTKRRVTCTTLAAIGDLHVRKAKAWRDCDGLAVEEVQGRDDGGDGSPCHPLRRKAATDPRAPSCTGVAQSGGSPLHFSTSPSPRTTAPPPPHHCSPLPATGSHPLLPLVRVKDGAARLTRRRRHRVGGEAHGARPAHVHPPAGCKAARPQVHRSLLGHSHSSPRGSVGEEERQ